MFSPNRRIPVERESYRLSAPEASEVIAAVTLAGFAVEAITQPCASTFLPDCGGKAEGIFWPDSESVNR
jgi:hypothetical protein